ncbi:MAG: metallophosphoesterase family protein [Elusimicrobiales bacterium]|nr:metallophosphoesterase family protein [Elusimicrobiales bacterium]
MIHAILSDIHANYEALKVVLEYLYKNSIKSYIITGDIIGYGPEPIECIDAVKNLGDSAMVVLGNHDAVISGKLEIKWFNDYARRSIEITKDKIDIERLSWFYNIPEKIKTEKYTIVHGSPRSPLKEYLLSEWQYVDNVKDVTTNIVFFGHTHIPMYFSTNSDNVAFGDFIKPFGKIRVNGNTKVFINPGSIGQPRDGNSMASFGIFDDETMIFELIRLNYDIKKTQELMKKNNIPDFLIERLEMGY